MDATVVIPTYNRRDALGETLAALARTDHPADRWEVVVVDDGSTDGTEAALPQGGVSVRLLRHANAGPAAARNRGAAAARGRVLVFIDNDIVVRPDFLRLHLQTLAEHPGCWVVGRVVHPPALRATSFGRYRDDVWEAFHEATPGPGITETPGMTAANLSLPADDFRRLGGFDTAFTLAGCEDAELGLRARRSGVRVLYHPGIVVVHNDWAVSLDRFCERQRLYSRTDVVMWRMYGEESPRALLVRENAPVDLRTDRAGVAARKVVKRVLATRPGHFLLHRACRLAGRVSPDGRLTRRLYDAAVGVAIFRGVREELARGGSGATPGKDAAAAGAGTAPAGGGPA